jgi:hypothetical protein
VPNHTSGRPAATQANTSGAGKIFIQDAQMLSQTNGGPQSSVQLLDSGQALPLSLARGDFNQDGIEDFVAGYAAPDGSGIVVLHAGNLDAFAPQSYDSWLAIGQSRFPSPFVDTASVFPVPSAPDFLATGTFGDGGNTDVVTAARGKSTVYLLAGDGQGKFATPQEISVPGPITAMAAGRFGSSILRSNVLIGIGGSQPAVLLYSGSSQGLQLTARYNLAAPATSFAFDDLDGDGLPDALILAGGQISILHAKVASGQVKLETLSLPVSPVAAIAGFFVHDRGWRRQMAVLDQSGAVAIVAHGGFDSRGWTKEEVKAMRDALVHNRPNPFRPAVTGPIQNGWQVIETLPAMATYNGAGRVPLLLSWRITGQGTDDVLVIDSDRGQMAVASHAHVHGGASSFTPAQVSMRPYGGARLWRRFRSASMWTPEKD